MSLSPRPNLSPGLVTVGLIVFTLFPDRVMDVCNQTPRLIKEHPGRPSAALMLTLLTPIELQRVAHAVGELTKGDHAEVLQRLQDRC